MTDRDSGRRLEWLKSQDAPGIVQSEHYHAGYFDSKDLDLAASQQRHLDMLLQNHTPGASDVVVDVGCGRGNTARWIRRQFGSAVVGIDIFDAVLQSGRACDDLPLAQSDMTRLPFRSNCVDLIIGVESIYGIPDRGVAFAEFARTLRPGGVLVLSDFMLGDGPSRSSTRFVSAVVHSKSLATEAVYRAQLHEAGFENISTVDVGEFTAVGTAAFLKAHPQLRHRLFRAQLGARRGALFSIVGFPLFYRFWCRAFTSKRCRQVFVTARRRC